MQVFICPYILHNIVNLLIDLQITPGFQGCKYFGCTNTYTFSTSILYIFWSDSALFQLCWFLSQGNLRIIRWFNVREVRCIYCVENVPLWVVSLAYITTLRSEIWPRGRDRSGVPLISVQSKDLEISFFKIFVFMDPPFINKVTKVTVRNILLIYFQELVLLKVPTISLSRLVIIDWFTITISLTT